MSADGSFTCAQCGGTFEKAWTDDEAQAEGDDVFGDQLGDDPAVVCDDCYQAMNTAIPMRDFAQEQRDFLAQYADPNRPAACEECGRRPVPSRLAPGQWVESHSGSCSQNTALQVCERCGHRHADRDFGQVLSCVMDVPLEEGRDMQRRIVERLER